MLPFIAGAVVGAAAVIVYNKNEAVKNTIDSSAKKVKTLAEGGLEKSKEIAKDVKSTAEEKIQSLKTKEKTSEQKDSEVEKEAKENGKSSEAKEKKEKGE